MVMKKLKAPENRGRVYSTLNLILLCVLCSIVTWTVKSWAVDWWGYNVTAGVLLTEGLSMLWEWAADPGSKTDLTAVFYFICAAISGIMAIIRLWKKRRKNDK
jgi:hypothetical protein